MRRIYDVFLTGEFLPTDVPRFFKCFVTFPSEFFPLSKNRGLIFRQPDGSRLNEAFRDVPIWATPPANIEIESDEVRIHVEDILHNRLDFPLSGIPVEVRFIIEEKI